MPKFLIVMCIFAAVTVLRGTDLNLKLKNVKNVVHLSSFIQLFHKSWCIWVMFWILYPFRKIFTTLMSQLLDVFIA